jgi:hypothetical protein
MKLNYKQITDLELLVDATSMGDVLAALSEIASEKAEHIQSSWNDKHLAKTWRKVSYVIDCSANHTAMRNIP